MKKHYSFGITLIVLTFTLLFCLYSKIYADELSSDKDIREHYSKAMEDTDYIIFKAKVLEIEYDDTAEKRNVSLEADIRYQHLKIEILDGSHKGETMTIRHTIERIMPGYYIFKAGDKLLIRATEDNGKIETVKIQEKVRDTQVYLIVGLFVTLLLIIGGIKGLKTLVSLVIAVAMIFFGYIPLIIKGVSPILASLGISIPVVIITLIIISGKNIKTFVAIIGTSLGVIISGILAFIFGNFAHLTGLADDSSISLAYIPQFRNLDYKGILFGTILIGAIGAIMDVAISIASALYEINDLDKNISKKNMIISGMNIGKDMMGSMSNTLILAYVGTTLHLIILFIVYRIRFTEIINLDSIATEIIRAMAGSIGLIITIPVTVVIGTAIYKKKKA
ncbi:YibE/F-like protein [Catonella morbi ATCC 51271]|uniref:YibE/F-like protein n=1 Tax=Catonella morbi ATCC 51271 TaxID=592026 RepID=V2XYD7_9FIRM|nr:YibE/F family protein [Catonella morbi]ESL01743.1 YibE/F-like protein [Catonella morbi ATCC 51271]